jgi:hypothetical protein
MLPRRGFGRRESWGTRKKRSGQNSSITIFDPLLLAI